NEWRGGIDADLVVLSACETGLGKDAGGDGLLGFAQAFLSAGARSVVLSRWQVDDVATALLMVRFYQNLLGKREGLKKPLGRYDASVAGSSLLSLDLSFVERHGQPPGRLLDLGCGTGRLLIHAARKGYAPVGIDLSAEMLSVAAAKAREASVSVDLVRASIVE